MFPENVRRIAVRVYEALGSFRRAAKILIIGKSTLQRWSVRISPRLRSTPPKLTPDILLVVKEAVNSDPFVTVTRLVTQVSNITGVVISKKLASLAIKRCGYSRKRTRKKERAPSQQDVTTFQASVANIDMSDCIFVDETSLCSNDIPKYGYSTRGTRLSRVTGPRGKNVTLTLAMTNRGAMHSTTVIGA